MSKKPPENSKSTIYEIRHRYSDVRLVRVWPEWESPGLWAPRHIGATPVGGYISPDRIGITKELKIRLAAWQERYDAQNPPQFMSEIERCDFDAEGLNIALQLSHDLGSAWVVEYALANQNLLFRAGLCEVIFKRPPGPADP
jgi:hypothetical protein